jgi:hypothetical protein
VLLQPGAGTDDVLYFFRPAFLHEVIHNETALYIQRARGILVNDARWRAQAMPDPRAPAEPDIGR